MSFEKIKNFCYKLGNNPKFSNFIVALILINAITIGLETSSILSEKFGVWFHIPLTILFSQCLS